MSYIAPIRGGLTPSQYYSAANKGLGGKIYNVEHYGAVHDGVTDDTSSIQDAINACFAAGGGTVYFPNGIYIIAGALQNDVGIDAIDYNSQLYIPANTESSFKHIKLVGESYNWLVNFSAVYDLTGVVLKSTIAGTGVFPSVICARGPVTTYGPMNYTNVEIENIKVVVDAFETTTGPSMCGINFMYSSHSYFNNVTVCVDAKAADTIIPESHVFGIATGIINNDFPQVGFISVSGFYYGVIFGEGVCAKTVQAYFCYIGIMFLKSNYAIAIQYLTLNWCAYPLAGQQETIYGIAPHDSEAKIDFCSIEDGYAGDGRTPAWCYHADYIKDDAANLIYGVMDYIISAESGLNAELTKSTGGKNLLCRNLKHGGAYTWTSATRPFINGKPTVIGFNTTTGKHECWNGTAVKELY